MLQIKSNNKIVTPMRPDAPNTFGSQDVPHGTDSCIYKAAKVLASNGANIDLPKFTDEEVQAMVEAQKANVVMLPLKNEDGEVIRYDILPSDMHFVEPNDEEVKKEYYSNYPLRQKFSTKIEKQEVDGKMVDVTVQVESVLEVRQSEPDEFGKTEDKYANLDACKEAIIENKKQVLAESKVNHRIEQCLDVPVLDDDFKSRFEIKDVVEI